MKKSLKEQCITYSQMNLIFNARIYYRRLTTWTRAYILSKYFQMGSTEDMFGRLFLESLDIGEMLRIIFGRLYSEQYGHLLSQFVILLHSLLSAQQEGNTEAIAHNVERMYKNVADRAKFLDTINPYWDEAEYKYLLETYLQSTIELSDLFITGEYDKDIEIYDRLKEHTDEMGDVFALGLYDYITSSLRNDDIMERSDEQCITYEQMDQIYDIRMFWFELITWTRNYMISRYRGIGDAEKVYARLKQVPMDYVDKLRIVYGDRVTDDYIQLFDTYIELLDMLITAQLKGNVDEINCVTRQLYRNADERAAFIFAINPLWSEDEWRARLYTHLRSTIDESTTFLTGDYARNIDIFSRLLDQAESVSYYFARIIFDHIISNRAVTNDDIIPLRQTDEIMNI